MKEQIFTEIISHAPNWLIGQLTTTQSVKHQSHIDSLGKSNLSELMGKNHRPVFNVMQTRDDDSPVEVLSKCAEAFIHGAYRQARAEIFGPRETLGHVTNSLSDEYHRARIDMLGNKLSRVSTLLRFMHNISEGHLSPDYRGNRTVYERAQTLINEYIKPAVPVRTATPPGSQNAIVPTT